MRDIVSFFTENHEINHKEVAKKAFADALEILCHTYQQNTAGIKAHYLPDLLVETLRGLQDYFNNCPKLVGRNTGDEKLLKDLARQLEEEALIADLLQTLYTNLKAIQPGFFNRGHVYPTFAIILALPCFKILLLLRVMEHERRVTNEALSTAIQQRETQVTINQELGEKNKEDRRQTRDGAFHALSSSNEEGSDEADSGPLKSTLTF